MENTFDIFREEFEGIHVAGGFCAPVTSLYDLVGSWAREPWRYADDPFRRYAIDWDLFIAPRYTRWQRRWRVRRKNLRDAWQVLLHGLPPERDDDNW